MPRIKAQNRGSTVHYDTIPIGHIWIDPFVATKSNQFWGKKPDTTIPMYFIGWFFILKTDYRKWILVWWISNNWNKYQISPLITVSLDNGRKVSKKWHSNLRISSKFDNDTHPFRLSQCTLPRYQFEKHSGNLFFFYLIKPIESFQPISSRGTNRVSKWNFY